MGVDGIGLPTLMSYLEEAIAEFPKSEFSK